MRLRAVYLALAIALAPCAHGRAQTPGRAIHDALATLAQGPGGCFQVPEAVPFTNPAFPGVRFFRADCVREHGDLGRATVALDADSVLYLLGTPTGFQLLVRRHRPLVDSASALTFAFFAAEMSGVLGGRPTLVTQMSDVPLQAYPRAKDFFSRCDGGPNHVTRDGNGFTVCGLARTANGALYSWEAVVSRVGDVWFQSHYRIFPSDSGAGAG